MDIDKIKKDLKIAEEIVQVIPSPELQKIAFDKVIDALFGEKEAKPSHIPVATGGITPLADRNTPPAINAVRASKTGLTDDEIQTLFEVKDKDVVLRIQPGGVTVSEQQQTLAHAILVGYFALLGNDDISAKKMGAAARDWKLLDTNFSRTILGPGHIQSKGKRASVRYSLKPGAMAKVKETLQKMARGE